MNKFMHSGVAGLLAMGCNVALVGASLLLTGCTGGEAVVAAGGASWFNFDRRTAGAVVDDQTITVKANVAIAKDRALWKSSHISTLSYNGTLLLVGQTTSQANKAQVEKLASKISGVKAVYNQVVVTKPIPMKIRSNDTWLTTQVKARIMSDRNIGINRVKVITEDGVVYLMGKLTRDEEQSTINIARRVPGVKRVITVIERESP